MIRFEKLKNKDFVRIKEEIFEILYTQKEADAVLPPKYIVKEYLAIYLHKKGDKSLFPTNYLKIYSNKILFFSEDNFIRIGKEDIIFIKNSVYSHRTLIDNKK